MPFSQTGHIISGPSVQLVAIDWKTGEEKFEEKVVNILPGFLQMGPT